MDAGSEDPRWLDAMLAAALVAIDPAGLGGACIRAGHGPARDLWLHRLRELLPDNEPMRRIPLHISDDRLLGGLDLAATLRSGRPVVQRGVLAEADGGFLVLPMAERFAASTLAHISGVLDSGEVVLERHGIAERVPTRLGVVALDESLDDERRLRADLLDRLPFWLDLSDLRPVETGGVAHRESIERARAALGAVRVGARIGEALCAAAMRLGIGSLRPSLMALRAARALAALAGNAEVDDDDAAAAARLILAPRATLLPDVGSDEPAAGDDARQTRTSGDVPDDRSAADAQAGRADQPPEDVVLAAALAAMSKGLLDRLRAERSGPARARSEGRSGAPQKSQQRGRPVGVRRAAPGGNARLNLIETLRAAAPWQRLRRATTGARKPRRIEIRSEDFHVTRYRQRRQTTTIFVVDASGSAALNRLAEAKGAVELLLADCYVRRDQVAVVAFRGRTAELLLPPTRSLLRAKRNLAGLPGGGGTPLAAGIDAGIAVAEQVRRAGQSATLVLLTDGQANVALDGSGGRERAWRDAESAAKRARAASVTMLLIDISPRSQAQAAALAAMMSAHYLTLPHADAATLSAAVKDLA